MYINSVFVGPFYFHKSYTIQGSHQFDLTYPLHGVLWVSQFKNLTVLAIYIVNQYLF